MRIKDIGDNNNRDLSKPGSSQNPQDGSARRRGLLFSGQDPKTFGKPSTSASEERTETEQASGSSSGLEKKQSDSRQASPLPQRRFLDTDTPEEAPPDEVSHLVNETHHQLDEAINTLRTALRGGISLSDMRKHLHPDANTPDLYPNSTHSSIYPESNASEQPAFGSSLKSEPSDNHLRPDAMLDTSRFGFRPLKSEPSDNHLRPDAMLDIPRYADSIPSSTHSEQKRSEADFMDNSASTSDYFNEDQTRSQTATHLNQLLQEHGLENLSPDKMSGSQLVTYYETKRKTASDAYKPEFNDTDSVPVERVKQDDIVKREREKLIDASRLANIPEKDWKPDDKKLHRKLKVQGYWNGTHKYQSLVDKGLEDTTAESRTVAQREEYNRIMNE